MCGQAGARHLQNCPAGGRNMVDYRAVMGRSLDGAHWAPPCFLSCSPRTMSMLPLLLKHHLNTLTCFLPHRRRRLEHFLNIYMEKSCYNKQLAHSKQQLGPAALSGPPQAPIFFKNNTCHHPHTYEHMFLHITHTHQLGPAALSAPPQAQFFETTCFCVCSPPPLPFTIPHKHSHTYATFF